MKIIKQLSIAAVVVIGFSAQAFAEGSVARALFARSIVDREPVEQVIELQNDVNKVYFFTELRGLKGKGVIHRWEYAGEPQAAVTINVGANRWRTWSSKNLQPNWTGIWTVSVVDEDGTLLAEERFNYVTSAAAEGDAGQEMVGDAPAE